MNYHLIEAKYIGATNNQGSRVKLTSHRFKQSKIIPFDYSLNNIFDMAIYYLNIQGFEIIGHGETKDGYAIITNTFKAIK